MPDTTTEQIKERLPIEQLVGQYVPLKKAGRIFKANCPFHNEKTPSFTVSPDRGVFKCFGCGKGGDIFDFVMEIEGLTFPETVKLLADKTGVELPEWKPQNGQASTGPSRTRLYELNSFVARLWNQVLTNHPKAEIARSYLKQRGVSEDSIKVFQIGYAPYGTGTGTGLTQGGYTRQEVQAAGEPTKFQDRITFPITDLTGKVIGFTGRLLELKDDPHGGASRGPKYWNTPETPIFIKSKALFGLHLAKHAMQKEGVAILAEGQMDVVMLHQYGYTQTVASSGTALTSEQLKLIGRFAPVVAFAYDGDKAGIEATKRGIELTLQQELTPFVIKIPNGKDPADCILHDPKAWDIAYTNRQLALNWVIDQTIGEEAAHEQLTAEQKKKLGVTLIRWLTFIHNPAEQEEWLLTLSAKLQTSTDNLRQLYQRLYPDKALGTALEGTTSSVAPTSSHQHSLADTVLVILLAFPETYPALKNQLKTTPLTTSNPLFQKILSLVLTTPENENMETHVNQHLSDDERKDLALQSEELLVHYGDIELSPSWAITELSLILQRVRTESRDQAKAYISEQIQRAQQLGDVEKIKALFQELQNLIY